MRPLSLLLFALAGLALLASAIVLTLARRADPQSTRIAFLGWHNGEGNVLYQMNSDGSDLRRVTWLPLADPDFAWTADGQIIIFPSNPLRQNTRHLYRLPRNGHRLYQISREEAQRLLPAWSPDGEWLASRLRSPGRATLLYRALTVSLDPAWLTDNAAKGDAPLWSPDGEWVAFMSYLPGGRFQPRLTFAAPTEAQPLTIAQRGTLTWSPDREWLVFSTDSGNDGDPELYRVRRDGSDFKRLTNTGGSNRNPVWSPDGQWLVFESSRHATRDLYRMRPDGSDEQRLTYTPFDDSSPQWSPDGQWIVFESQRDGDMEIYRMRADGSQPARLTTRPGPDFAPRWSPIVDRDWNHRGVLWAGAVGLCLAGLGGLYSRARRAV